MSEDEALEGWSSRMRMESGDNRDLYWKVGVAIEDIADVRLVDSGGFEGLPQMET